MKISLKAYLALYIQKTTSKCTVNHGIVDLVGPYLRLLPDLCAAHFKWLKLQVSHDCDYGPLDRVDIRDNKVFWTVLSYSYEASFTSASKVPLMHNTGLLRCSSLWTMISQWMICLIQFPGHESAPNGCDKHYSETSCTLSVGLPEYNSPVLQEGERWSLEFQHLTALNPTRYRMHR